MNAYVLTCSLIVFHLAATSAHAATVVEMQTREFEAAAGGLLADDNGDGVFDRASPGNFGVGGGNSYLGKQEYQGAYEFDLRTLASQLPANEGILSVRLKMELSALGAMSYTPNILGIVGGYIGNGALGLRDADRGSPIGSFWVWNHNLVSFPYVNPRVDVTDFFLSSRAAGVQYIGFNFRPSTVPDGSVDNWYTAPRLEVTWIVPEPSSALFVMFGSMAVMLRRWRTNRAPTE